MPRLILTLVGALVALLGCTPSSPQLPDAGLASDLGADRGADAEIADASRPDARTPRPDSGPDLDAQLPDARLPDAQLPDAQLPDAQLPDAQLPDAQLPDAQLPDARLPDAQLPDARLPDARLPDATVAPCRVNCAELDPAEVVEHRAVAVESCAFQLRRTGDPAAARALAAEISQSARGRVAFTAVNLNRTAEDGITAAAADRLRNHPFEGLRWNAGDMATADWYPQGITGISDAVAADDAPDRRLLVVSWYDHRDARPTKGVRISIVDFTNPAAVRYRHLLLVVPERVGGRATFAAVTTANGGPLHAGGITWIGDLLYVADTTEGFRVFDVSQAIEVTHFDDRDRIGVSDGRVDAHGYRYIVPQIDRYQRLPDSCPLRFSFAGLDRSGEVPQIVSGEYRSDDPGGRVVRWPVGPDGWLQERGAQVTASDALVTGQTRVQGGLTWQGDVYLSSSSQAGRLGRLYRTRPGLAESSISAWVYGCEDLYFERHTDRIWTAAEHPGARDVVSIRRLAP
ncbi:MAG: hypothetical protein ACI9U2_001963 [Bradymonadia bacterium]|jgi:hypothetical protein